MHVDLDQASASAGEQAGTPDFESDVCIVGGGIAGLTLATRLADLGFAVHVLEAGGLEQEEQSQGFYATEQAATMHRGSTDGRFRTFGGSSTRWGGQLLPFTSDIFDPPEGSASRSWPIREEELTPYYDDVQRIFDVDRLPFEAALLPALGHPPVPFTPAIRLRYSKWAPFRRRNMAQTLGVHALASSRITIFTHANVTELKGGVEGPAGHGLSHRISAVRVLNYASREFRFAAEYFVVAAGTVESARILLSSPAVPNSHDQLGRFFNDHLSMHAASFEGAARDAVLRRLGPFFVDGTLHTCKLEASGEARARDGLLAVMAHVVVIEPEDSGPAALRNLLRAVQEGKLKQALLVNVLPMVRGIADVFRLAFAARFMRRRAVSRRAAVLLNIDVEQGSRAENCIRLSRDMDALGMRKAVIDWRVGEQERRSALHFSRMLRGELDALDLAPEWDAALLKGACPEMLDTYHAMGGLCMGSEAETSVVDAQLRVHSVANVYVASCAVFPSGSSSNPTFTLMALTMRLADHLARLGGRLKVN